MKDTPEISAAKIKVERSRTRVMATAQELQDDSAPRHYPKGSGRRREEKGADLAEVAVDAVKARPLTTTSVVAAITMFLAREPLMNLAGRRSREAGVTNQKTRQVPARASPDRLLRRKGQ